MDPFLPREPFNTWSHALGILLSLLATVILLRRGRDQGSPRLPLLIFGFSLILCYTASTLIHALRLPPHQLDLFDRFDRFGIFVLIAGTYTPMTVILMRGRWRFFTLLGVWGVTAAAGVALATLGVFPPLINTGLYLAMGWASVICLYQIAQIVPIRNLFWLILGGVLYSIGAIINFIAWPALAPPHFGPHELFHLFVLGGSTSHVLFVDRIIAGFPSAPQPTNLDTRSASLHPGA